MSETPDIRPLVAVGGNSRAARSMRARLQWRDRFGRWIEMGRGVKFKVRGADGAPRSVIGKFVGALDDNTGQVYVSRDPNGLPDGFYQVKSDNAQEIIADLSPKQLRDRRIEVGQDAEGNPVGERLSENIPPINQIVRNDAPEGWKLLPDTLGGRKVMETEDGDFRIAFGGTDNKWIVENRAARGKGFAFNTPGEAFQDVEEQDQKNATTPGGNAPAAPAAAPDQKSAADLDAQIARQEEQVQRAYGAGNDVRIQAAEQILNDLKAERAALDAPGVNNNAPGGVDTDTFDVAKEGFAIPTGKKTTDLSPEGLANFVNNEKEALSKGGARIVVDTDKGEAEIYNSADNLENARAQAGGLGQDRVLDLASGQEVAVSDGAVDPNAPEVNPNLNGDTSPEAPNAEDRNPDAVQPQPTDARPASPASPVVDEQAERRDQPAADSDAGDQPAPAGADNARLEAISKKLDDLDAKVDGRPTPSEERAYEEFLGERSENLTGLNDDMIDQGPAPEPAADRNNIEARKRALRDIIDGLANARDRDEIQAVLDRNEQFIDDLYAENKVNAREMIDPHLGRAIDRVEKANPPKPAPAPGSLEDLQARRESFQKDFMAAPDVKDKLALSQEMRKLDQEIARKELDNAPEAEQREDSEAAERPAEAPGGWAEGGVPTEQEIQNAPDGATVIRRDSNDNRVFYQKKDGNWYRFDPGVNEGNLDPENMRGAEVMRQDARLGRLRAVSGGQDELALSLNRENWWNPTQDGNDGEDAPLPRNTAEEPPVDAPRNRGDMVNANDIQPGDVVADWAGDPRIVIDNQEFNPRGDRMLKFPIEEGKQGNWLVSPVAEIERLDNTSANKYRGEFNGGPRPDLAGRFTLGERTVIRDGKPGDIIRRDASPFDVQEGDWVRDPEGNPVRVEGIVEDDASAGPVFRVYFGEEGDYFEVSRAGALDIVKGEEPNAGELRVNNVSDEDILFPEDGELIAFGDIGGESDMRAVLDAARRYRDSGQGDPQVDQLIDDLEFELGDRPARDNNGEDDFDQILRDEMAKVDAAREAFNAGVADIPDDELAERIANLEGLERDGFLSPEMDGELQAYRGDLIRRNREMQQAEPEPIADVAARVLSGQGDAEDVARVREQLRTWDENGNRIDGRIGMNPESARIRQRTNAEAEERLQSSLPPQQAQRFLFRPNVAVRDLLPGDKFIDPNDIEQQWQVVSVNPDQNVVGNVRVIDPNNGGDVQVRDMDLNFVMPILRPNDPEDFEDTDVPPVAPAQPPTPPTPPNDVPGDNGGDGDSEPETSGLPDDVDELERLAGNMERALAGARPARKRVLEGEIEKIYDKIDRLMEEAGPGVPVVPNDVPERENEPEADAPVVEPLAAWERELLEGWNNDPAGQPEAQDAPGPDVDPVVAKPNMESRIRVARVKMAGKDIREDEREELEWNLRQGSLDDDLMGRIEGIIDRAPNRPNTRTERKPDNQQPERHLTMEPAMAQAENDPNFIPDDDAIWAQIKRENPGFKFLPNGDMVIASNHNYVDKHGNDRGKNYDLVVRHTLDNRFQVYILETDKETGNRVALRVGVESHSYKALSKYIAQGRDNVLDNRSLHVTVSRAQRGKEVLGRDRNLGDDIIQQFIENGRYLGDAGVARNVALENVYARIMNGQAPDDIIASLPNIAKSDADLADALRQAFYVRSIKKANKVRRARREPHKDYDGRQLEVGQWFDWTDWRVELDVHVPALRRPNPNYGKVYRGQIKGLMERNAAGEYEYSDNVQVRFAPDQGLGAGKWVKRVAANLRIVDDPQQPLGAPFFAKVVEKRGGAEGIAEAFGVPKARDNAKSVPRKVQPKRREGEFRLEDGRIPGYENIYVPRERDNLLKQVNNGVNGIVEADDLQPGHIILRLGEDGIQPEIILERNVVGTGRRSILAARVKGSGFEYRTFEMPVDQQVPVWGPLEEPKPTFARGDVIHPVNRPNNKYLVRGVDPDGRVRAYGRGLLGEDLVYNADEVIKVEPRNAMPGATERDGLRDRIEKLELPGARVKNNFKRMLANPDMDDQDFIELEEYVGEWEEREGKNPPNAGAAAGIPDVGGDNNNRITDIVLNASKGDLRVAVPRDILAKDVPANVVAIEHPGRTMAGLQTGDFFQRVSENDNSLKILQVLEINKESRSVRVRFIGERSSSAYMRAGRRYKNGDEFSMPFASVSKGVFFQRPKPAAMAKFFTIPSLPEPPSNMSILGRMRERSEELKAAYEKVKNQVEDRGFGGKDNNYGAAHDLAKIVTTPDGERLFIKRAPDHVGVNLHPRKVAMASEYLATRVGAVLGIVGPKGGPIGGVMDEEKGIYVGEVIDGEVAWDARKKGIKLKGYENSQTPPNELAVRNMWEIPNAWRMAILDRIIENHDRHDQNWMIGKDGIPYPIDHGNVGWMNRGRWRSEFASKLMADVKNGTAPLTSAQLLRMKNELAALMPEFQAAGQTQWYNNMMSNLEIIIDGVKKNGR